MAGFSSSPSDPADAIELDDAEAGRILDSIAEDGRAVVALVGATQHRREALPVEDVVPEHEATRPALQEVLGDHEGLGQSLRS